MLSCVMDRPPNELNQLKAQMIEIGTFMISHYGGRGLIAIEHAYSQIRKDPLSPALIQAPPLAEVPPLLEEPGDPDPVELINLRP